MMEESSLKLSFYCIIISVAIILVSPVYAALNGTDTETLRQAFQAGGFLMEEIEPLLRDQRLALHPEILNQKTKGINYLHPRFGLLSQSSIKRGQKVLKENRITLKNIEFSY
jgi:hypothetical protein